jgi:dynein heavy chain
MEELEYPLSDNDFSQQWTLLTWPSKIEKLCEKAEKTLYGDMDRYQKEMEGEQAIFVNTLESLDATVSTFPNYTDMTQVHFNKRYCAFLDLSFLFFLAYCRNVMF